MKSIKSPKKGEKWQKGGNHNVKQRIHETMWHFFVFNLWWLRHINIIAPSDIEVPKKIFFGKLPDTVHFQCPLFRLKIAFPTHTVDRLWTGCGPAVDSLSTTWDKGALCSSNKRSMLVSNIWSLWKWTYSGTIIHLYPLTVGSTGLFVPQEQGHISPSMTQYSRRTLYLVRSRIFQIDNVEPKLRIQTEMKNTLVLSLSESVYVPRLKNLVSNVVSVHLWFWLWEVECKSQKDELLFYGSLKKFKKWLQSIFGDLSMFDFQLTLSRFW